MSTTPLPPQVTMNLPPEIEEGHYADFANIWHTPETFVLDFAGLTHPVMPVENDAGQTVPHLQCRVVTRVRVPASQVWEIMKALESQLSAWEMESGKQAGPQADPSS